LLVINSLPKKVLGLPESNGKVPGWEFDLMIELSVVQSCTPTFDLRLVKTSLNNKSPHKKGLNAPYKKVSWPSLMHKKPDIQGFHKKIKMIRVKGSWKFIFLNPKKVYKNTLICIEQCDLLALSVLLKLEKECVEEKDGLLMNGQCQLEEKC